MKKAFVLGAGFSGCLASYFLRKHGWTVSVFEKESFVGGGARTFEYGGHPYTLGPRIFHCPKSRYDIYEFMNKIVPMREIPHYLMTYIEQDCSFYSYPIHEDDINLMPDVEQIRAELNSRPLDYTPKDFEGFWISSIGETLYKKYVCDYSKKMWQIDDNKKISDFSKTVKGDAIKKGDREVLMFDWINAYPVAMSGYNDFFDYCLQGVELNLGCEISDFDIDKKRISVFGEMKEADLIISTISPDQLLSYAYGELPYMGRDFVELVLPHEHVFSGDVQFLYNPNPGGFLRTVEYKHLTGHVDASSSLLLMEIPSKNNKLYPYPFESEYDRARKYLDALPDNVYALGRMGRYKYTNFWEIISDMFELEAAIK